MQKILTSSLGLGLVLGIIGFAVYFFAFGQTYDGNVRIFPENDQPGAVGLVTFQSRFRNRRFLTHTVTLDLYPDTPTTYRGEVITTREALDRFTNGEIQARVGYRERKPGWGKVVTLDLEPSGSSPKETLLIASLLLIFGSTIGMAILAKME